MRQKREGQGFLMNQQLSFLLPLPMKAYIEPIKEEARQVAKGAVHIFHQLPTYPRKHLTVTLLGPWQQLLLTKDAILR